MIEVFAVGRVAKDAEVFEYGTRRDTKTGISFGLICERFSQDENPVYIKVTKYGPDENLAKHITMGRQMCVRGYLNITKDKEGRYWTDINANYIEFGAKPGRDQGDGGNGRRRTVQRDDYDPDARPSNKGDYRVEPDDGSDGLGGGYDPYAGNY